ncbi:hypothetical protein I8752_30920 [Nostocaceae cyanobacterium CENA369]|uniref:Uncharacterized protein n=1 Tax=Dendronalium phyllosphericum CENA369 TaxID=1725256 RepID=A0A8J7IK51_9NOST|nr:hypothetical protein [Dendronalium phyllosphericum]MBH8577302.1 hypothetical protein [Dendronalium phyllosphericum CENA369]
MLEKLWLAVVLTFALSLFTELNLSSPTWIAGKMNLYNQEVFTLTQLHK